MRTIHFDLCCAHPAFRKMNWRRNFGADWHGRFATDGGILPVAACQRTIGFRAESAVSRSRNIAYRFAIRLVA